MPQKDSPPSQFRDLRHFSGHGIPSAKTRTVLGTVGWLLTLFLKDLRSNVYQTDLLNCYSTPKAASL